MKNHGVLHLVLSGQEILQCYHKACDTANTRQCDGLAAVEISRTSSAGEVAPAAAAQAEPAAGRRAKTS